MLSVDVLDELHDRKDKLVSRIYMRKLEELLLEDDKMLTRCSYCGKLFALCNRRKLVWTLFVSVCASHMCATAIHRLLLSDGAIGQSCVELTIWLCAPTGMSKSQNLYRLPRQRDCRACSHGQLGHEQIPPQSARTQAVVAGNLLEGVGHHCDTSLHSVQEELPCS
jgi:hypothetical protein